MTNVKDQEELYSQYLQFFAIARAGQPITGSEFQPKGPLLPNWDCWAMAFGVFHGKDIRAPLRKSEFIMELQKAMG